jgi:ceramide glucosyltransferase
MIPTLPSIAAMRAAEWIAFFFTLAALASLVYFLLVFLGARAWVRRRRTPLPPSFPPVSILKPLKGSDPGMYTGFASHCVQHYPADYEILFGVSSPDDPAVAVVEQLQREFPDRAIHLVVCPQALGANGKVSTLAQMVPHARYGHLLINDSDVRVSPEYLRQTMPAFAEGPAGARPVGMVTALYRGRVHGGLWSRLEALGISTDFMPGVLTARWLEKGLHFGLGSTLAVTREALAAIGGLFPLVDHLADDYELGARIAQAGFRVELARETVETSVPAYTFREFAAHQLRWSRTVRASRPWGYAGLLITFGLPWAVAAVIASAASIDTVALLLVLLCVRVLVALRVGAGILGDAGALRDLWLLPLRDGVGLLLWCWSFASDTILWRGQRFRLRKGRLISETPR